MSFIEPIRPLIDAGMVFEAISPHAYKCFSRMLHFTSKALQDGGTGDIQ